MQKLVFPALLALALLGGCNSQNPSSESQRQANAPQPIPNAVTGTVSLHEPMAIGPGAQLDVKLVDVVQPEMPVAEKTQTVSGQPPYRFSLPFDASKVDATRTYVVNVTLTDGDRHFVPALNSPVLTGGAGASAQIVLNAEATPGEKMDSEYNKIQAHIGAMKKIEGTYTTDTASVGWDAFISERQVRFMRVNTVEDKGGRSSVKYAFKDGKPFELVQQEGGVTTRAGWDENGAVVVNRKSDGSTLSDTDAAALYQQAGDALKRARAKAGSAVK
jgi:putative lipoprotein